MNATNESGGLAVLARLPNLCLSIGEQEALHRKWERTGRPALEPPKAVDDWRVYRRLFLFLRTNSTLLVKLFP